MMQTSIENELTNIFHECNDGLYQISVYLKEDGFVCDVYPTTIQKEPQYRTMHVNLLVMAKSKATALSEASYININASAALPDLEPPLQKFVQAILKIDRLAQYIVSVNNYLLADRTLSVTQADKLSRKQWHLLMMLSREYVGQYNISVQGNYRDAGFQVFVGRKGVGGSQSALYILTESTFRPKNTLDPKLDGQSLYQFAQIRGRIDAIAYHCGFNLDDQTLAKSQPEQPTKQTNSQNETGADMKDDLNATPEQQIRMVLDTMPDEKAVSCLKENLTTYENMNVTNKVEAIKESLHDHGQDSTSTQCDIPSLYSALKEVASRSKIEIITGSVRADAPIQLYRPEKEQPKTKSITVAIPSSANEEGLCDWSESKRVVVDFDIDIDIKELYCTSDSPVFGGFSLMLLEFNHDVIIDVIISVISSGAYGSPVSCILSDDRNTISLRIEKKHVIDYQVSDGLIKRDNKYEPDLEDSVLLKRMVADNIIRDIFIKTMS